MQILFQATILARRALAGPVYLVVPLILLVLSLIAAYYFLLDSISGLVLASPP